MLLPLAPLAILLGLAAQAGAAPPPPAPVSEGATAPTDPEAEKAAADAAPDAGPDAGPAPIEPAPIASPPPEPTPAPAAPKADPRPIEPGGIDTPAMIAIQLAVGTGACCVGCCVAVPFTLPLSIGLAAVPIASSLVPSIVSDVVIGTTIGAAEGLAGDAWGKGRGALILPVASSVGMLALGTVGTLVLDAVSPPVAFDRTNPQEILQAQTTGPLALARLGIGCGTLLGAIALPAIVYALTSSPKKPGDTGQGFPGIITPADPVPATRAPPALAGAVAMRF